MTTELDEAQPSPATPAATPRRRRRSDPRVTWAVRVVAVASGAAAAVTTSAAPTGLAAADRLWAGVVAALVVLFVSRATRNTWLWMAAVAAVTAVGSWAVVPAIGALVVAAASTTRPTRPRVHGALVGGLGAVSLLNLPAVGPHGLTAAVAVIAVAPAVRAGYRRSPRSVRRRTRRSLAVVAAAVVLAGAAAVVAALLAAGHLYQGVGDAQDGLDLVRDGEQIEGARRFDDAARDFASAESMLNGWWTYPARTLPVVSQHSRAMQEMASSGHDIARAAEVAASVAPYRDLKSDGGRVDIVAMQAMQRPVADAASSLLAAEGDLDGVRSPWLLEPVSAAIEEFDAAIAEARPEAVVADHALTIAPGILGADGPRSYLVLFTTPAEARNLGGFTGSYGILTADRGQVDFTVTGEINDLSRSSDWTTRHLDDHPEFLARYGRYRPYRNFQNLTASPDMQTTAEVSADLYRQTTGNTVDGVVVVDPIAIAALLELTGPVEVEGMDQPLTADNAADFLLRDQYVLYEDEHDDRKDRLEGAGRATFDALTERELPGPREIGQVLGPVVDQKRLMFYPLRAAEQALFEEVGALGRFEVPDGTDFVSLRTANARANKIDSFLRRRLDYDVHYEPSTGTVRATATVTLRNDAPSGGLPDYVIGPDDGSVPLGTTRQFVAVYSPLMVRSVSLDGRPVGVAVQRELGTNVFSRMVTIPPGGTVTVAFELEGIIEMGDDYRLVANSQPLVNPDELHVALGPEDGSPPVSAHQPFTVEDGLATDEQSRWQTDLQYRASFG